MPRLRAPTSLQAAIRRTPAPTSCGSAAKERPPQCSLPVISGGRLPVTKGRPPRSSPTRALAGGNFDADPRTYCRDARWQGLARGQRVEPPCWKFPRQTVLPSGERCDPGWSAHDTFCRDAMRARGCAAPGRGGAWARDVTAWAAVGRFCCRSRRRRERSLAPSYKLSLPLARESGVWGLP
jgi:hypothetical protein